MTGDPGSVASQYVDQSGRVVTVAPEVLARVRAAAGSEVPIAGVRAQPLPALDRRRWGWQVQLYQLRSAQSWGIGDYVDLATLATGLARRGADLLLVNPLHADTPVAPFGNSPYFPSSRRYVSQLSISVHALPEYCAAPEPVRRAVDALRPPAGPLIDRPAIWAAKLAALALLAPPDLSVDRLVADQDDASTLVLFAQFCALAEIFGQRWRDWPTEFHRPGPQASAAADATRVAFHIWVQLRARDQLATAQRAAQEAGMSIGVVHDLAVGVDPNGADSWAHHEVVAAGMTIGAPPDEFNQLGQDWGLPAWRPDRLAAQDFAPWRAVVASALEFGGGLRIDHVLGLSRLWWVPVGSGPAAGAFVSYDTEAMLGAVVDAARARGGLVIGEDLGTVDPALRERLAELGVLGSAVLWFEGTEEGESRRPGDWRAEAAASVSTHDLPTAYGFLTAEHVRIRDEAGVLAVPVEQEYETAKADREALLALMISEGVLDPGDAERPEIVVDAMYSMLTLSPSLIVLAAPADAVGDVHQPNLPGTVDQYPNWRLPLADAEGVEVTVEEFLASPGVARLSQVLRDGLADRR